MRCSVSSLLDGIESAPGLDPSWVLGRNLFKRRITPASDYYIIVLSNYGAMAGSVINDHIEDVILPRS